MHDKVRATALMLAALGMRATAAEMSLGDAPALPLASKRILASAEECAIWNRERSFAHSVEAHDEKTWASYLHPGVVFNVGPEPNRGIEAVRTIWPGISGGKNFVLRWRPGIVNLSGDMQAAVSLGPYVFQVRKNGVERFEVGLYQTVWVRDQRDGAWRVLFDGEASTAIQVADRAAADAWVTEQPMSSCDEPSAKP